LRAGRWGYVEESPDAAAHAEDAHANAPGEADPSEAYERRMAKSIAPGDRTPIAAPKAYAGCNRYSHYRRR